MTITRDTFATNSVTAVAGSGSSVSIGSASQYVLASGSTPSHAVTEGDTRYPLITVGSGYGGSYYRVRLAYVDDDHCFEFLFGTTGVTFDIFRNGATVSMSQSSLGASPSGTNVFQVAFNPLRGNVAYSMDTGAFPTYGTVTGAIGMTGTTALADGGLTIVRAGIQAPSVGADWTSVVVSTRAGSFGVAGGRASRLWTPGDEPAPLAASVQRYDPDESLTGLISAKLYGHQPGFRLALRRTSAGNRGYLVAPDLIRRMSSTNGVLTTDTPTGVPTFADGDTFSVLLSESGGTWTMDLQHNGSTYYSTSSMGTPASGSGFYFGWWQDAIDSRIQEYPVGGSTLDDSNLNSVWTRLDEIYWSPTGEPFVPPAPLSLKLADGTFVLVADDGRFKLKSADGTWWKAAPDTSGARELKLKLADGTWASAAFLIPT